MDLGHFYFINDQYYIDYPDQYLMKNHEIINGVKHDRPCFYAFEDAKTGLFWLIPFTSKVSKFQAVYNDKINKYNKCDTIVFGKVLGHQKAFLIQNMCPITQAYIRNEYLDGNNVPVRINGVLEQELIKKATKVLKLQRLGKKLIFPDVLSIEASLINKQSH